MTQPRDMCSTPYGITARCISRLVRHRRGRERVLNALRHHGSVHKDIAASCGPEDRMARAQRLTASRLGAYHDDDRHGLERRVLNALRHHGSVHGPLSSLALTYAPECSTPYGITARCIGEHARMPLTPSMCSTPYGITARCICPGPTPCPFSSVRAQRLTASRLGALVRPNHVQDGVDVLNALRHHGSVHRRRRRERWGAGACAQRLTASRLGACRLPRSARRRRRAQRLTASRLGALK